MRYLPTTAAPLGLVAALLVLAAEPARADVGEVSAATASVTGEAADAAKPNAPDAPPADAAPKAATPPSPRAVAGRVRRPRVEWDPAWPRFRWWEYVGTGVVYVADWYVRYHMPPPEHNSWVGNNFFDDSIRKWLRASSHGGRETAVHISDYVSYAGTFYPFVVDLPIVLFVHREPGVMWQMLMMNLEANAVAGLLNNTLFHYGGRGRPNTANCNADGSYDALCGGIGNNASFPSGHTLTIATAAGLTCVHHRYLPIYGNDVADTGACVLLTAATVVTGVSRIVADRHFASDVIIGGLIGFGSGYGLPWLLHYRTRRTTTQPAEVRSAAAVLPMAGPGMLGLSFVGIGPY